MGCGCGKRVKTKLAQAKTGVEPAAPVKASGPALWTGPPPKPA